ncbi:MAG: multi-sensor signal transduction histidine kinase [Nitrobacter sp.]|uniref:sensor histidine kinase n=1 Tax=Nitrobacter sp. TaxID=29420 RepID=UPI00387DD961
MALTSVKSSRHALGQIILLAAGLAVLTLISALSVYLVNKAREDASWTLHSMEVENEISLAQLQMRRAESAQRGFLLTQRPEFRSAFEEAASQIPPSFERLKALTIDNPYQQRRLEQMIPQTDARIAQLRHGIALVQANRLSEATETARQEAGRDAMGQIRDLASEMRAEEDRLFAARTASADASQSLSALITSIGSGLIVVFAGLSIFLVRRSSRARDEAEAQLRDNNLNLESTVEERTSDLREANDEIQRFAYIVSHDLRSPLVNIMGFTSELEELRGDIFRRIATLSRPDDIPPPATEDPAAVAEPVLDEADEQLSQDFTEALGFIKSSIAKMDRLISAILNLTREGRREFYPAAIAMRDMMENIASTMAHQAAEAGAEIRIEPLPDIVSDRLAIEQIFSNLIDNALKYLKPGVPGAIAIRGRRKLGFAIFEVTDNGRGIDPKDYQRIFDLFRRAGPQDRPGQGIGLAHARTLVRRLGGTMSVSSEINQGSTFTVTLPTSWTDTNRDKPS